MRRETLSLVLIGLLWALAGCDDETVQTGDLQVNYRVGSGAQNCEQAGIATVRVQIMVGDAIEAEQTVACAPAAQTVMFQDLEVGSYTVHVDGMNSEGTTTYTGETETPVTVEANQTNGPVEVMLQQVRPSILIWFDFVEPGNCLSFEVQDIQVRLYENSATVVYDETVACDEQMFASLLIDDLNDTSTYDLRIRGLNSNSEYTYQYNEDAIEVQAGAQTVIEANLESCNGICSAP